MRKDWTPGQKLFVAVLPDWDQYYDEPPEVDEEAIWRVIASILETREVMILEIRFGRRYGRSLTLEDTGKLIPRHGGGKGGISRERVRSIEAKALRKLCHPRRRRLLEAAATPETVAKAEKAWQMRSAEIDKLLRKDEKEGGSERHYTG